MQKITVHSDGGARGNPGPAGIGVVVTDGKGKILAEISEHIGDSTNNVAEYTAVLHGLVAVKTLLGGQTRIVPIDWKLDSELVVKQLAGEYKVKNPGLRALHQEIQDLRAEFPHLTFTHVRREQNVEADRLVNEALDKAAS
jgi:ribonuclease HI